MSFKSLFRASGERAPLTIVTPERLRGGDQMAGKILQDMLGNVVENQGIDDSTADFESLRGSSEPLTLAQLEGLATLYPEWMVMSGIVDGKFTKRYSRQAVPGIEWIPTEVVMRCFEQADDISEHSAILILEGINLTAKEPTPISQADFYSVAMLENYLIAESEYQMIGRG